MAALRRRNEVGVHIEYVDSHVRYVWMVAKEDPPATDGLVIRWALQLRCRTAEDFVFQSRLLHIRI